MLDSHGYHQTFFVGGTNCFCFSSINSHFYISFPSFCMQVNANAIFPILNNEDSRAIIVKKSLFLAIEKVYFFFKIWPVYKSSTKFRPSECWTSLSIQFKLNPRHYKHNYFELLRLLENIFFETWEFYMKFLKHWRRKNSGKGRVYPDTTGIQSDDA